MPLKVCLDCIQGFFLYMLEQNEKMICQHIEVYMKEGIEINSVESCVCMTVYRHSDHSGQHC